jgi:hypothetical protein
MIQRSHDVPRSLLIGGVPFRTERDERPNLPATTNGNAAWTVIGEVNGREYRMGLHYCAKTNTYHAAGSLTGYPSGIEALRRVR